MDFKASSPLFGRNIFADAFQEFDEDSFFANLHNTVRNKSYFEKYKGFKTTLLYLSYLFNLASIFTASYAVFWLTHHLTGIKSISWILAGLFLFFLEQIKRKSSTEFWQVWFFKRNLAIGWLILSLLCFSISLGSSAFGAKEGTEDLNSDPELIATDSTAQDYRNQIAKLEADNLKLEEQRNAAGEIYWTAQKEKQINKELIADLTSRILALDQKLEGKNEKLTHQYRSDLKTTAATLAWITILMEILFEMCIAYIWYYYFRSYVERKRTKGIPQDSSPALPSVSNGFDPNTLSQIIAQTIEQLEEQRSATNGHVVSPPSHQSSFNGINHSPDIQNRTPIGFRIQAHRDRSDKNEGLDTAPLPESSVQACTGVYTQELKIDNDPYTVLHEYRKGNKVIKTPYTENQILARISQYERQIEEAIRKQMGQDVIQNRKQWFGYWKSKLQELYRKQEITI